MIKFESQQSIARKPYRQLIVGFQIFMAKQDINAECPNIDVRRLTNNLRLSRFV